LIRARRIIRSVFIALSSRNGRAIRRLHGMDFPFQQLNLGRRWRNSSGCT
jgi:hypothetical protein